jgi:hypothetical protein
VVFDESVFPFSTTPTPTSTPELDIFSLFPTDAVLEPPFSDVSCRYYSTVLLAGAVP